MTVSGAWDIAQGFQSTHPRRVRPRSASAFALPNPFQSTHPRRVRRRNSATNSTNSTFNPRTRVGCDWPRNS
ncbi:hypothetical protein DJ90_5995 [Paenibacillus macerans]|uniref:Uncharacterized protein n=1 Tax=Paenibacillus macerans TaxID=44252 RepID=A0A090Y6H6_PAEMA|nr:hypothetical protein DJ90_5995 [Paenibacillus macerans]